MAKRSRIHHYVPQHLISNFSGNEKGQVCVFDKHTEKSFWTNPKNVCAENGFNEFQHDDWIISFEDAVTRFENLYYPILKDVVEKGSLNHLDDEAFLTLRLFFAFQFLRTKFIRSQSDELHEALKEKLQAMGANIEDMAEFDEPNPEETKKHYLTSLFRETLKFAKMLDGRDIFLMTAPDDHAFILGDHPVVLHNDKKFGPYGNIGWAVIGIQIFIPISPTLVLACWCKTNIDDAIKERDELSQQMLKRMMEFRISFEVALKSIGLSADEYRSTMQQQNNMISGVRDRKLLDGNHNNTDFINSHQVIYSSRYLISNTADFELPKRMIADDKKYKGAPKPQIQ